MKIKNAIQKEIMITLNKLTLDSFRGVTAAYEFCMGLNLFKGPNGCGKTTIFDAYSWLIWGKDSIGKSDFDIKTLVDGQPVKNSEHSVEGHFAINMDSVNLKRVYFETYNRKGVKTGNKTLYFIGGVEVKKKDYDAFISGIWTEKTLLCSDIRYLTEKLAWKERRDLLTGMVDNIDHEKVIDAIDGFRDLLNGRGLDAAKTYAKQRQNKVTADLAQIKADIKANSDIVKNAAGDMPNEIDDVIIGVYKDAVTKAEQAISDFKQGDKSGDMRVIKEKNDQVYTLYSEFVRAKNEAIEYEDIRQKNITALKREIDILNQDLADHMAEREKLVGLWRDIKNRTPEDIKNVCEACGQTLPDEQYRALIDRFNSNKAEQLKENISRGQDIKAEIERISKEQLVLDIDRSHYEETIPDPIINQDSIPEIDALKAEIETLKRSTTDQVMPAELTETLATAKAELEKVRNTKAKLEAVQSADDQVKTLKESRKKLSAENDKIELFFIKHDEYNATMSEMIEKPVNDLFVITKFRLFKAQEDGKLVESCDVLNDELRPYQGALSTGEKIHVGCDIAQTMQHRFGISAPVWIDHAESVTGGYQFDCQYILLQTSEDTNELIKEV